jgi:hypothetical protein
MTAPLDFVSAPPYNAWTQLPRGANKRALALASDWGL